MNRRTFRWPGTRLAFSLIAAACAAATVPAQARVTKIVIDSTTALSGLSIPYESVRGRAFGELDGADAHNAVINDLSLNGTYFVRAA